MRDIKRYLTSSTEFMRQRRGPSEFSAFTIRRLGDGLWDMYPAGSRRLMASRLEDWLPSKHESLIDSATQVWSPEGDSSRSKETIDASPASALMKQIASGKLQPRSAGQRICLGGSLLKRTSINLHSHFIAVMEPTESKLQSAS